MKKLMKEVEVLFNGTYGLLDNYNVWKLCQEQGVTTYWINDDRLAVPNEDGWYIKLSDSDSSDLVMHRHADDWFEHKEELKKFFLSNKVGVMEYNKIASALFRIILGRDFDAREHDKMGRNGELWFTSETSDKEDTIITYASFGSCSCCDALEAANDYEDNEKRTQAYMNIALNMFQHAKFIYRYRDVAYEFLSSYEEKEKLIEHQD